MLDHSQLSSYIALLILLLIYGGNEFVRYSMVRSCKELLLNDECIIRACSISHMIGMNDEDN